MFLGDHCEKVVWTQMGHNPHWFKKDQHQFTSFQTGPIRNPEQSLLFHPRQITNRLTPFLPPPAFSFHVLLYLHSHHEIQVFCLFSTNCSLNEIFHLHVFNDYSARDGIWSFNYAIYITEWIMLRFQITWISE